MHLAFAYLEEFTASLFEHLPITTDMRVNMIYVTTYYVFSSHLLKRTLVLVLACSIHNSKLLRHPKHKLVHVCKFQKDVKTTIEFKYE